MSITNGKLDNVQSEEKQEKAENIAPADVLETTRSKAKRKWCCNYSAGEQHDEEQHIHDQGKKKQLDKKDSSVPAIRDHKFELPELSRIFLGEAWRIVFTATTCFDLYGITWSIASVFASSLASDFSIRDNQDDYAIFILLFLVTVLGMSFFSIVEQLYVQLGFFVCRLIMVAIMLITVSIASTTDVAHFGEQEGPEKSSPLADFRTLHLSTLTFLISPPNNYNNNNKTLDPIPVLPKCDYFHPAVVTLDDNDSIPEDGNKEAEIVNYEDEYSTNNSVNSNEHSDLYD
eukprot:scaffold96253_cov52-Attheya_sp.AAC.1